MMVDTRIRGLSELHGSWNTACTVCRYRAKSSWANWVKSLP